ncbi:MAG: ABC transporter permease [Candidatus Omnitrophota bacterium]
MLNYIIRRLFFIIPMMLGISLLTLVIMHLAPGDPASIRYGLNPEVSDTARARLQQIYGLDKPVLVQYFNWVKRVITLDFGRSFIDDRPVIAKISERLPATLLLNICALFVIFTLAIPIGVTCALKQNSLYDKIMTLLVFVGYAVPGFWFALILMVIFGFKLGWLPVSGMSPWYAQYLSPFDKCVDLARHLILPVAATAFGGLAGLSRYARSSMLEVIRQDYIRTAKAKGLPDKEIVWRHAFRNALLPIITIIGFTIPGLISGSFIMETIFAWPGMGRLTYEAIMNYDYPVVMGGAVISIFLTLLGILISDILYVVADPRIRYK